MKAKELFEKGGELLHKLRTESDIIRYINNREAKAANYSLFLGAGVSVSSGISTANQLIDTWLVELYERFNQKNPENTNEARDYFKREHANWYNPANPYSSLFEKKYDLPSQRRRFIEQEVDKKLPSIGYAYLISLVDQNFFNTIFTTNFDDLLNEAFYQFSNNRPIYCAHDSSIHSISITSKRPKILKLHGDYLFDDIKSTLKETESLEQNTKEKLIEFCKEYGLIVIGYSGNDRSIMDVLEFLTKQENYLKNGVYWCLRSEDKVSLSLRNLLWKDKVYPVLIDGFDEFLAKTYNSLIGSGLDIESNIKQSKLQKTINNILNDKYGLSRNEIIKQEIELIKNSNSKNDISNFINELSKDSDSDLPLNDLRNLLEIEDLINKRNYPGAYDLCEAYFKNSQTDIATSKYLSKLISISLATEDRQLALKWSDSLIALDRYNLVYYFKKADCIFDLKKRYEFLTKLIDDFSYRYEIYNEIAQVGFHLFKNDPIFCGVNLGDLLQLFDKSLRLYPALSNPAWRNKIQIYQYLYTNDKTDSVHLDDINQLIDNARTCNAQHLATLNLVVDSIVCKEDYKEAKELIKNFYEFKQKASKSRKEEINYLTNKLIKSMEDFSKNEGYKDISKEFYEDHLKDIEIKDNCDLLLSKANYYISQKKDLLEAEKYFIQAIASKNLYSNIKEIIITSSVFEEDYLERIEKSLEKERYKLSLQYYNICKFDICLEQKKYSTAHDHLKKAFDAGGSIHEYLTHLSYLYLHTEDYEKIIELGDIYKEVLKQRKSEVFKINYQLAAQKLESEKYSELILRNLSAQSDSIDVRICAFSILGNNTDARRLIKSQIQKSYMKYYFYQRWPAIKIELLQEVKNIKVA